MFTLHTERLILRLPGPDDAQALADIHEHPANTHGVTLTAPKGGAAVAWRNIAMMLGHWQLRGYGHWVVVERDGNQVIGRVGFFYPFGWPGIELGWILHPDWTRRGLATEAAGRALSWMSLAHPQAKIISLIEARNLSSVRLACRLGAVIGEPVSIQGTAYTVYRYPSRRVEPM